MFHLSKSQEPRWAVVDYIRKTTLGNEIRDKMGWKEGIMGHYTCHKSWGLSLNRITGHLNIELEYVI